jgi:tRNA A37 threonylcarbamoyladenosine dehydratase
MPAATPSTTAAVAPADADLERRFGALRRLYGDAGYARLRAARVAVVGLGGVGSWAVEALARSGVAGLVLIDYDHVAESNVNRQVQALTATLGQAKGVALRERVAEIHPGCEVCLVDDFATPENWPGLLDRPVDALIDACDQARAKVALAAWALDHRMPMVSVGAAGGKTQAQRVEVADLAETTHDPLLASVRQRLRKAGAVARPGRAGRTGLRCVFSREAVAPPAESCEAPAAAGAMGRAAGRAASGAALACHGYGSSVTVTATFGMVAAGEVIAQLLGSAPTRPAADSRL